MGNNKILSTVLFKRVFQNFKLKINFLRNIPVDITDEKRTCIFRKVYVQFLFERLYDQSMNSIATGFAPAARDLNTAFIASSTEGKIPI